MIELGQWAYRLAVTVIVMAVAENVLNLSSKAHSARWLMRVILLGQLLMPLEQWISWLKGG